MGWLLKGTWCNLAETLDVPEQPPPSTVVSSTRHSFLVRSNYHVHYSSQHELICLLLPGDGVGKEITASVKEIFEHLNVPVEFEEFDGKQTTIH